MYNASEKELQDAYNLGWEDAVNGWIGDIYNRYGCTHKESHAAWQRGNDCMARNVALWDWKESN